MKKLISHLPPGQNWCLVIHSKTVFLFALLFVLVLEAHGQNGRVGINTATPLATLHVADSSVLFTGPSSLPDTPGPPPFSGPGIRTMWYPSKGAFRTGQAGGTEWNKDSIGIFSFGAGVYSKAKGAWSVSMGYNNKATAVNAVAIGSLNMASGTQSTAFGLANLASGSVSTAMGQNNQATGAWSTGLGTNNIATGMGSIAAGNTSIAFGTYSMVVGNNLMGNAYNSFTIGQNNDTLLASRTSWVNSDYLFAIGNGTSESARKNALTVLKNGNVGLFTSTPTFRLQVTNDNANDGGFAEGIMIENTNASVGEAAISFRNKGMPGNRQWMVGLNQTQILAFAYGTSFTAANTHMAIDTTGYVGLNTIAPQAPLHVIRNLPSGGSFISSPLAIFESNNISYIQLSHENTDETGIVSGNQVSLIRSALIFAADSSIDLRAGGNGTDLKISKDGNIGIGTTTPSAKLDVNGTVKLGMNGTVLQEIIKASINFNLPSIAAGATLTQTFTVTNAQTSSAVQVSQAGVFGDGLVIGSARVSAANTVEVRFVNTSAVAINPLAMDYHFTVIR